MHAQPASSKVYIGTAGWTIPRRTAQHFAEKGSALERYAGRFSAAEINSTFHRAHRPQTFARWAATVQEDFRFAIKLPKTITHGRKLAGTADLLKAFLEENQNLEPKRGPFLLQLPPSLAYDSKIARTFFDLLRTCTSHSVVCEPRHPTWFEEEAEHTLKAYAIARVAADPARVPAAGRPGGLGSLQYYRLHGAPRMYYSEYVPEFLSDLAEAITKSCAAEVWCIFDNTASGAATANALELQAMLQQRQRLRLKPETSLP
ncbi:MAG: DUF72 domain-containing protein [Xanthobacteraceae bacterium]